jgi:hypothetical protein
MELVPISRESMRSMNAEMIEERRKYQVEEVIRRIYNEAIQHARLTTDSVYKFINDTSQYSIIINNNMPEILVRLKTLFPECSVTNSDLIRGADGNMYEISQLQQGLILDPSMKKQRPHLRTGQIQECIIIDWS